RDRRRGTHAHEGAGLEHPQQLHLQLLRDLGDLVEEQRPAMAALEIALVLAVRAGERPLLVAEELALDQLWRHRAAVERQERRALAPAHLVDGLRGELLAGA